jgi:hypothetical protein
MLADRVLDRHTLNEKQDSIERAESHYNALILNPGNIEPLNVIVIAFGAIHYYI